jgi:hypothetical protein
MIDRRTLLQMLPAAAAAQQAPGKRFRIWDEHTHLGAVPGDTPEERMAF